MEKESYNIDDILSEVKKRREEQERALRMAEPDEVKTEEVETPQQTPQEAAPEFKEIIRSKEDTIKENSTEEVSMAEKSTAEKEEEQEPVEPQTDGQEAEEDSGKMVDILQFAGDTQNVITDRPKKSPVKEKFFKTKKGKIVKAIIIILVILIIAAGAAGAYFINNMLNGVTVEQEEPYKATEYYDGMDFLQENFPVIYEQSAYDVYSYKEYLKYWYQNGDPVRSSHVMNVLLIGEDTREAEIADASRADSAIIVSINIDTKTIHMTSVLRDLYVYYEINGEGHYGKINESASKGGMKAYINTLERYYKISIDNYAVVNFASFPKIIDALGGVEIPLTKAEVREVNNHQVRYAHVTLPDAQFDAEGNPLAIMLDGEQALAYCRIRKIDSDNARADRQKAVLNELFNKMKVSGKLDTVKVVNQLSQYTKTGFTKKELISIGNTALRDGWLNYPVETTNVPAEENSLGGQTFSVSYKNWIWLADIPKDAYELQMMIYGKSNIQLNEDRPNYISMGK
ncbi:MAG: LCP family protein [Eubacterium sp.]|nr:LCP family protein [Eubacterium sp.]